MFWVVLNLVSDKKFKKHSRNQLHAVVRKTFVSDKPPLFTETSIESEIHNA